MIVAKASRRHRNQPTIVVVLIVVVLVGSWIRERYVEHKYQSTEPGRYPARCFKVIDGDTLLVDWAEGRGEKIRLLGIDCMETHNVNKQEKQARRLGLSSTRVAGLGNEATAMTRDFAERRDVELVVPGDQFQRDTYDRILCYVERDGEDLCSLLLQAGLAETRREKHQRTRRYADVSREARAAQRGIYGR